jgi:hypothetical protein
MSNANNSVVANLKAANERKRILGVAFDLVNPILRAEELAHRGLITDADAQQHCWKDPIMALVTDEDLVQAGVTIGDVIESIEFFTATTAKVTTVRERIMSIGGISDIVVSDFLTGNKVVLAQASAQTMRIVRGMQIQTVQWSSGDGMSINFKVMAIMVPQIRADSANRCGVAYYNV